MIEKGEDEDVAINVVFVNCQYCTSHVITALIQTYKNLPVSGLATIGKKNVVSATGLGETKRSLLPR